MNNIKEDFTIKDLENISGIKAHTIRIWEKRYNLLAPRRTETNIRHYSLESLRKLLNVVLLNKNNYKISKIAEMSDDMIVIKSRELVAQSSINDQAINSLKLSMFTFDKVLFHNTYNSFLRKKTFREIFREIFVPLLNQIGLLWQTETLLPAHEHFISNLITQKIQINIEKLEYSVTNTDITYVLFLPENEIHDLGLMYLNYELDLRGFKTIYLGVNLALNHLNHFFKSDEKFCFLTSLLVEPYSDKVINYFYDVEKYLANTDHEFIAIGKKTELVSHLSFQANISIYTSFLEFIEEL